MKKTNKKGFTLVELLVVIVIIGILATVIVPSVAGNIEKANKSAAEQNAVSKYKEVFSALDLTKDSMPTNLFYFTGDYVVLVTNGSLVKDFTKKQSEITALHIPTASADETDKTKINGVEIKLNDIVILEDGTILRCDEINSSSKEPKWTKYEIKDGALVKVDASSSEMTSEQLLALAQQAYNTFGKTIYARNQQFIFCDGQNTVVFAVNNELEVVVDQIYVGLYIKKDEIVLNENEIDRTINLYSDEGFLSTERSIYAEYSSYLCIKDSGNTYNVYRVEQCECSICDPKPEEDPLAPEYIHIVWRVDYDKPTITLS